MPPIATREQHPLLEREAELDFVADRVAAAVRGHGSLTFVLGEAGIGKTSLLRAAAARVPGGVRVLGGACDALSTPRPLAPLHDIARQTGGDLAAAMASDVARHERFAALLAELEAPHSPAMIVIEDVHWADDATRDLLVYIARRVGRTRAAVFATARDDEVDRDHPLTEALGRLAGQPDVARIALARLGRDAVAQLAGERDADQVFDVTGGNPFFVTEIAAAEHGEDVPPTVRDAVLARVAGVSPAARHVIDVAALEPESAELDLVRAVAGGDPSAVDECVRSGMLRTDRGRLTFRHELARRAVEGALPPAQAEALHADILAFLERTPGADAARLAHHAERAGDRRATVRYASEAARRAVRLGAHRDAQRQLERALAASAGEPPADVALLWERLGRERSAVGDDLGELHCTERALEIWRSLGRVSDTGRVAAANSRALWCVGRGAEARQAGVAALEVFAGQEPTTDMATALASLAQLHMLAREIPAAIELGSRAAAIATRLGDTRVAVLALRVVGTSRWFAEPDTAEDPLRRSVELAERIGDDVAVASGLVNLGSGAGEVRRYDEARRWLGETIGWTARHDLDGLHGYATAWLARVDMETGDAEGAVRLALKVGGDAVITARIVALTVLGRTALRGGDPDADASLDEAWRLAVATRDLQRLWPAAAGRAERAWLRGEPASIPQLVGDVYELAVQLGQSWPIGELGFWLWRAGALDALPDDAAEPYRLAVGGDTAGAVRAWDELGCPFDRALALSTSADSEGLAEAVAGFDRLGARAFADETSERLRTSDGGRGIRRPRRSTAANPGGLTARELEVAGLLAEGATDAELAARLHISIKTAGHHVSAVLAKLGVGRRGEAAAVVRSWQRGRKDGESPPPG